MTDAHLHDKTPAARRLACARCGVEFDCKLSAECWCAAEPLRLPVPPADTGAGTAQDCVCPACLRTMRGAAKLG